jgi:Molybdopterin-binding domain of aldehyde dehydrogenase
MRSPASRSEIPNLRNGCHVCEVETDPETGATRVLRYVVVDDVGTVVTHIDMPAAPGKVWRAILAALRC